MQLNVILKISLSGNWVLSPHGSSLMAGPPIESARMLAVGGPKMLRFADDFSEKSTPWGNLSVI